MPKNRHRRSIERRLKEVGEALEVLVAIDPDWLWEFQRRREMVAVPDGLPSNTRAERSHGVALEHAQSCPAKDDKRGECDCGAGVALTSVEGAAARMRPGCAHPRFVKLDGIKEAYCARCGRARRDHVSDPIGAEVEAVFDLLDTATQALRMIARRSDVVLHQADAERGRQVTTDQCLTCGRSVPGEAADQRKGERLRAGLCPACHSAFMRWKKDRVAAGRDPSPVVFRWERRVERQLAAEQAS